MSADILIVDDEADIRALIKGILEDEGYRTRQAGNSKQVYERISERVPDLIILDIWLQHSDHDGMQILESVKRDHSHLPVLMISGHGTIETAVQAIKQGAYDFIEKPFKSDRLLVMIERALEAAKLKKENESLKLLAEVPSELVGDSAPMAGIRAILSRVAQTSSRVLITGEAGSGKDVAARQIHKLSPRRNNPFMVLNCAILRPDRLDLELFGNEEGFMGEPARAGVLERADGGTLLLDEVADMPLETQAKIVRVLQEQRFQRLGGKDMIEVDVRVISTTNRDLQALMQEGKFRQDLYFRLNVVPVQIPALREHPQDITGLAEYFSSLYSRQSGLPACRFSEEALAALQVCDWPGNVRQLRNVVERTMIMNPAQAEGNRIGIEQLPREVLPALNAGADMVGNGDSSSVAGFISVPLREAREIFERDYILSQIRRFGGNISKTAQFVGMERSALHRKMKQLGIGTGSKQNDDDPGIPEDRNVEENTSSVRKTA